MKKNEFLQQLSKYCEFEIENPTLVTQLNSIDGYDSLALMSIIAFIDENFKMSLKTDELNQLTDFNSLIALIGLDKFEND
jgi:acyl carrier protein